MGTGPMFTVGNGSFRMETSEIRPVTNSIGGTGCDGFPGKGPKMGTSPRPKNGDRSNVHGRKRNVSSGNARDLTCPQFDWGDGVRRFPRQRPKNGAGSIHGRKRSFRLETPEI